MAGSAALSAGVLETQIVVKTDGVPLFVEEFNEMVLELDLHAGGQGQRTRPAEAGAAVPLGIPATLHDALMARLDRLNTAKEIAQLAATLGREFSYELLRAVSSSDEETLRQGLRRLVDAELIYQRGMPPQATYLFKHALAPRRRVSFVAQEQPPADSPTRSRKFSREPFPDIKETQPELLAHHYTEAGQNIARDTGPGNARGREPWSGPLTLEGISHLNLVGSGCSIPYLIQRSGLRKN